MKEDPMTIPHLFRCPISLDLFTDPVTLCTGQTYDRSSIEKWFSAGNLTCPVTMQRLHDPSVVPNHTLRHLIDQWIRMENPFDPDYLQAIDPDLSLATMKHNLESQDASFATKLETLRKIRILSEELVSKRSCLIQLGFFELLLRLSFGISCHVEAKLSEEILQFAEESLICLLKLLPFSELGSLNMLKEDSNLASFLVYFHRGTTKIKMSLCNLVEAIASSSETKDLSAVLGQNRSLLQGLVLLLHQKSEASEAGIKAILALCSSEVNRDNVIREGGLDGLIMYISSANPRPSPIALAAIEVLLGQDSAKEAVINNPNAVISLVKNVFRVSDHQGSESAVSSLLIICYDSLRVREDVICAGVLTQLLLLLQSQCSCRTKKKARVLLKLLRSMWGEDPSICKLQYGLVDA
ncbi:hypothetical protein HHK36_009239 [Tetracentron sinense]|uniref:U-box domain-containing protein n=1 Tax=Tetracentron sinense TaxID=13715 RepID=A0A835DI80_TETSI|nr:hypothetical protein HHK36_009239 [Tetracentron sinense]